LRINRIDLNE
jgi:hypothetical protein